MMLFLVLSDDPMFDFSFIMVMTCNLWNRHVIGSGIVQYNG